MVKYDDDLEGKTEAELIEYIQSLRFMKIYGFWNAQGVLVYAGQSAEIVCRLKKHILEANPDGKHWSRMLFELLNGDGFYFTVIYDALDELQANDVEFLLARKIKQNPDTAGNEMGGRLTERMKELSEDQRDMETEEYWAKAHEVFEANKGDLIKASNINAVYEYLRELHGEPDDEDVSDN